MRAVFAAILLSTLAACSGEDPVAVSNDEGGGGMAPEGCTSGQIELEDGRCLDAGAQPNGCAAGEQISGDGSCLAAGDPGNTCQAGEWLRDGQCLPAGVPSDGCGEGFIYDDDGGCEPIIADICEPGRMANLGETTCRLVAPCASGIWGDIPVEASTVHVDQAASAPGDGSAQAPYPTIQAAVDAATPGAVVAVAAGTYTEDVVIEGKAISLWGKCPGEVSIQGSAAAVTLGDGADQSVLRGLALTGAGRGLFVAGAQDVLVERVWVHDTAGRGIEAADAGTGTSLTLQDSLVEAAYEYGVLLAGTDATLRRMVIRDTAPTPSHGWGLTLQVDESTGAEASFTVEDVVLDRNAESGAFVYQAEGTIDRLLVRDTQPNGLGRFGRGLSIQDDEVFAAVADVTLRRSVIDGAYDAGIMISGSKAMLEQVAVRNVVANLDQERRGNGVVAQPTPPTGLRTDLTMRGCLVEQATDHGLFLGAADVLLEGVLVKQTQPLPSGERGRGASIQSDPASGQRSVATVRGCAFRDNDEVGFVIVGSDVGVEGCLVENTQPMALDDSLGIGLAVQDDQVLLEPASVELVGNVLRHNHFGGIFVAGSDVVIERTLVSDSLPAMDASGFGRGINIQDDIETGLLASGRVIGSLVEGSHEAGIMVTGGQFELEGLLIRETSGASVDTFGSRGISVQKNYQSDTPAEATLRHSVVESTRGGGVMVSGAMLEARGLLVKNTTPVEDVFGDGLSVLASEGATTLVLEGSRIEQSERAGVSNFGGLVELGSTWLDCNAIDLAAQALFGGDPNFVDLQGNDCGCGGEEAVCKALSSELTPPEALTSGSL